MSNVLSDHRKQQVIALSRLGWSLRRIEQETGVRRETASTYLKAAGISVPPPGRRSRQGPAKPAIPVTPDPELGKPTNQQDADGNPSKPAIPVTPDFGVEQAAPPACFTDANRGLSASACQPFREAIELGLRQGRNAKGIWQDLVSQVGFPGSYQAVKRFVRKLRGGQTKKAFAVIVTAPGEEAQVDYGQGPLVRDPRTGNYRHTRLFVMTLGYSRKAVRLLTFRSSTRIWAELHEKAFRRLRASPRVMVLDNLTEGVLEPDIYDPKLNPLYRDVLAHYNVIALPCRVKDPNRKGKVESGVGHTKKTPLKGKRFESLEEAQTYLDEWETRWADTRIHGTTKRQVAAMFAEEKPCLQPLPLEPFRYYKFGKRTVHPDGCVEIDAAYYSVPPGWLGHELPVQWDGRFVRILHPITGELMREHWVEKPGKHCIKPEDRPAHTPLPVNNLLWRAQQAGPHIGTLCHDLYRRQGQVAVRRIQGLLSLAKKFGTPALNKACAVALEMRVPEYRFVKHYLQHCLPSPLTLRQVDPLIRQLTEYRDLVQQKSKENQEKQGELFHESD